MNWLPKELEAIDLLGGFVGGFGVLEDDEGLALGLEIRLGYDVKNIPILGEDCLQSLLERLWLDALLEIADVDAIQLGLATNACPSFQREVRVGVQ